LKNKVVTMTNKFAPEEMELLVYLDEIFGTYLPEIIQRPEGYKVGERVLYKLKDGVEIIREEDEGADVEEFSKIIEDLADKSGGTVSEIKPVVSSGRNDLRIVDIPGWKISFPRPMKKYFDSDEVTPGPDFIIEWLFGVYFGHSEKKLICIDMTHPYVNGIFSATYEMEDDCSISPDKIEDYFNEFNFNLINLRKESENDNFDVEWIKQIQIDKELMYRMRRI